MFDWWIESENELSILETILDCAENVDSVLETLSPFNGMNVLHIATRNDLPKTAEILLNRHSDKKAYMDTRWGADSKSALHEACYKKNSSCGLFLLEAGAIANSKCTVSLSKPLHIAALSGSNVLLPLLAAGAKVEAEDACGRRPLHLAEQQNWWQGIYQLIEFGANSEAVPRERQLAFDTYGEATNDGDGWCPWHPDDILNSLSVLRHASRNRAPYPILSQILNVAEYWTLNSAWTAHIMLVEQANCGRPYLLSKSVDGYVKKVRVLIRCQSHEGSYTAMYPSRRSWTWFELAKLEAGGGAYQPLIPGPKLVHNDLLHTQGKLHTHELCFLAGSSGSGRGNGIEVRNWMMRLKHGERVAIVPMARWPERINRVMGARIEIWTTLLGNLEEGEEEVWEKELEVDARRSGRGYTDTFF